MLWAPVNLRQAASKDQVRQTALVQLFALRREKDQFTAGRSEGFISTQSGLSAAAPSESRLGEAVMDAEVANCSVSKHGPGQSVKFLAAREHIDNQPYALDLCL